MSTQTDVVIDEKIKRVNKMPGKYNVIMFNDDSTPMEWVVSILRDIFKHRTAVAEEITMTIHNEGSAVVGTYTYEIAEQKAVETVNLSRSNGFPLQVKVDEEK